MRLFSTIAILVALCASAFSQSAVRTIISTASSEASAEVVLYQPGLIHFATVEVPALGNSATITLEYIDPYGDVVYTIGSIPDAATTLVTSASAEEFSTDQDPGVLLIGATPGTQWKLRTTFEAAEEDGTYDRVIVTQYQE